MYDYVESLYIGKSDRFFDGILGGGIAKTIMTGSESSVILGNIYMDNSGGNYAGNVYDTERIAPTLNTSQGGNREPLIVSSRGRNPNNPSDRSTNNLEQRLEVQSDGISNTLTTFQKDNYVLEQTPISTKGKENVFTEYAIRKLTPKECFRLMGVKDEDYDKLTVSNSQKYKQAGNSIVVDVLMAIFKNMFINDCKSNRLF